MSDSPALAAVQSELATSVHLTPPTDNAAARRELEDMGVVFKGQGSNVAARNRVTTYCKSHHLELYAERASFRSNMRTGLTFGDSQSRICLWGVEWNTKEMDDLVFVVVYRAAVQAFDRLVQHKLVAPLSTSDETKEWVTVTGYEYTFQPSDEFVCRLIDEGVSHVSFDAEGRGHCSCGRCAGGNPCADTFVQLGVWRTDGTCHVLVDYYPSHGQWIQRISQQLAPNVRVVTWDEELTAQAIFGARTLDIQPLMSGVICDSLHLAHVQRLSLKKAFKWVAFRRNEKVYEYPKPRLCYTPFGCWQRKRGSLLTDAHMKYACVDAFATAALWCEWLRCDGQVPTGNA